MELVIASTNMHKVREIKQLLKGMDFDVLSLHDFPSYIPPEETENSFEGNAVLKAKNAAEALDKWVLADDSGLIVPGLGGLPGVHSARYAGEKATDRENYQKLLEAMKGMQDTARFAYFVSAIAITSPGATKVHCFQGVCEGEILEEAKGCNGFSYDAVFRKHDYNKSFAELEDDIKSRISHRRKAFDKAVLFLESILQEHALSH